MSKPAGREILIEIQRVGMYLRATAIDPETLTEVTTMGPLNAEVQLRRNAAAKLEYVLAKKSQK